MVEDEAGVTIGTATAMGGAAVKTKGGAADNTNGGAAARTTGAADTGDGVVGAGDGGTCAIVACGAGVVWVAVGDVCCWCIFQARPNRRKIVYTSSTANKIPT